MAESGVVKNGALYGARWVWFVLVAILWRIVIGLVAGIGALVLLVPPWLIFAVGSTGSEPGVGLLLGILSFFGWLFILGVVGYKTRLGYPRIDVDIWLHQDGLE